MKPWNTDLSMVEADETLYFDYKDQDKQELLMVKLKSKRISEWISFYEGKYSREKCHDAIWESKQGDDLLKIKSRAKTKYTIKFHYGTGVITVQGTECLKWASTDYKSIISALDKKMNLEIEENNLKNMDIEPKYDESLYTSKQNSTDFYTSTSFSTVPSPFTATPTQSTKTRSIDIDLKSPSPEVHVKDTAGLNEIIDNVSKKLSSSPSTTKYFLDKHFEQTDSKIQNLESCVIQDRCDIKSHLSEILSELSFIKKQSAAHIQSMQSKLDALSTKVENQNVAIEKLKIFLYDKEKTKEHISKTIKDTPVLKRNYGCQTDTLPTASFNTLQIMSSAIGCQTEQLTIPKSEDKSGENTNTKLVTGNAETTDEDTKQVKDTPNKTPQLRVVKDPSEVMGRNRAAEVVFICDSVGKHIDQERFYGRKRVYQVKSPKAEYSRELLSSWKNLDSVETCIIHQGINDITDNSPVEILCNNLKDLLCQANELYKNAQIVYSEILTTNICPYNDVVVHVNNEMKQFCIDNNFIYCSHTLHKSKPDWFVDYKHINEESGTKVFVSELQKAGRRLHEISAKNEPWKQRETLNEYYDTGRGSKPSKVVSPQPRREFTSYRFGNPKSQTSGQMITYDRFQNQGRQKFSRQEFANERYTDQAFPRFSRLDNQEKQENQEIIKDGSIDKMMKLLTLKMLQSL